MDQVGDDGRVVEDEFPRDVGEPKVEEEEEELLDQGGRHEILCDVETERQVWFRGPHPSPLDSPLVVEGRRGSESRRRTPLWLGVIIEHVRRDIGTSTWVMTG